MSSQADSLKDGVASSLQRRPSIANATAPVGAGRANREFEGRRGLGNAGRIKLARIKPDPDQPRKSFPTESLDRLAENMRIRGQLVPILVRWSPADDTYFVIDGERRYRAALQAGLADMACVVEEESSPDTILELQLIANALREDVAPVEQARAWERLRDSQGLSLRQLGDKLGYDYSTIAKGLDLLKLAPEVQARVDSGELAASTAGQIARIGDYAEQRAVADRAVAEDMSRAEVTAAVEKIKPRGAVPVKPKGKGGNGKVATSRTFKFPGGLRVEAMRARGLDPLALVEALRSALAEVEAEIEVGGGRP